MHKCINKNTNRVKKACWEIWMKKTRFCDIYDNTEVPKNANKVLIRVMSYSKIISFG